MAKTLEAAGKEENISFIHAHHDKMMQEYEAVFSEINSEGGTHS